MRSGSCTPGWLQSAREGAVGKGLLWASRPWQVLWARSTALWRPSPRGWPWTSCGCSGGPDKGFYCVPAWVSVMSLPDPTERGAGRELKVSCWCFSQWGLAAAP